MSATLEKILEEINLTKDAIKAASTVVEVNDLTGVLSKLYEKLHSANTVLNEAKVLKG